MRSGELRQQDLEQGSQQRFPSSSHVVNKLKEAQIHSNSNFGFALDSQLLMEVDCV
jgi:hypothetical protein